MSKSGSWHNPDEPFLEDMDDIDTDQPENLAELEKGVMIWAGGCLATVVLILGVLVWVIMAGRHGLH